MSKIKEYLKDKSLGFYFTAAITFLSLVTAIIYVSCYGGSKDMNWLAFVLLLVGIIGTVVLIVFKQFRFAPALLAVCTGIAFMLFIHAMSFYVSVVLVGIDLEAFSAPFIVCTIFFAITFVASVANIFLKQVKEPEEACGIDGTLNGVKS